MDPRPSSLPMGAPPIVHGVAQEKEPDLSLRQFAIAYAFAIPLLALFAFLLWLPLHGDFLGLYAQVLFWIGLGYVFASVLAWTGFANVYRWSPTLYVGLPSYRRRVARGALYWEGRSTGALLGGLLFGAGLVGLAAVLWNPVLAPAALAALAGLLTFRATRKAKGNPEGPPRR